MNEEEKNMEVDFSLAGDNQIPQIDRMRLDSYFEIAQWSKAKRTPEQVRVASDPVGTQVVAASLGDLVVASFRLQLVNTRAELEREAGVAMPFHQDGFPAVVLRRACVLSIDYWECFKALHSFCLYNAYCMAARVTAQIGVMAERNPLSPAFALLGDSRQAQATPSAFSTFAGRHVTVHNSSVEFPSALLGILAQIVTGRFSAYKWKGDRPFKQLLSN